MKLRVAQTIVAIPKAGSLVIYNFLTRTAVSCSRDALYWMSCFETWREIDSIAKAHPHIDPPSIERELLKLVALGILHQERSPNVEFEEKYGDCWEWGLAAGLFHFSLQNNQFMDQSEALKQRRLRAAHDPSPELVWQNSNYQEIVGCNQESPISQLLELMASRRTNRTIGGPRIELGQLKDCLYAGLGITGQISTETGSLPLSMTPSGGARNPYEAFILAQNVLGLTPGFYHYSAVQNSIQLVSNKMPGNPSSLVANQDWTNEMPAIVFLVAIFERTMWKYADPNAYRVVLIEAGHIGQNIMLAATAHGLSACPTAALCHDVIGSYLDLKKITHVPIYALTLGIPGDDDASTASYHSV